MGEKSKIGFRGAKFFTYHVHISKDILSMQWMHLYYQLKVLIVPLKWYLLTA